MNSPIQLEKLDVAGLESIAEGRAAVVPEHVVARLLALGLVQPSGDNLLTLTSKGLAFIRSSDQ